VECQRVRSVSQSRVNIRADVPSFALHLGGGSDDLSDTLLSSKGPPFALIANSAVDAALGVFTCNELLPVA